MGDEPQREITDPQAAVEEVDPRVFSLETQESASGDPEYRSPFERAQDLYETAQQQLARTGNALKPAELAPIQLQMAQFEMLAAIHEAVERVERNTRSSAADEAITALLGKMTGGGA